MNGPRLKNGWNMKSFHPGHHSVPGEEVMFFCAWETKKHPKYQWLIAGNLKKLQKNIENHEIIRNPCMIIEPFLNKSVWNWFQAIHQSTRNLSGSGSCFLDASCQHTSWNLKVSHATMGHEWNKAIHNTRHFMFTRFSPHKQRCSFFPSHACVNSSFASLFFNSLTSKQRKPRIQTENNLRHRLCTTNPGTFMGDSTIFLMFLSQDWQLQTLWTFRADPSCLLQKPPALPSHSTARLPLRQEAYLELLPILLPLAEDSTILPHRSSPATAIAAEWKKSKKTILAIFSHTIVHSR